MADRTRKLLRRLGERQVDKPPEGVPGGPPPADGGAGAQAPAAAPPAPAVPVIFHDVVVVAQAVDVQQPVDGHVENLHEAAEFDHGGDQALERLPDALLEISALEESRDVAIGLIGTLLEPRSA